MGVKKQLREKKIGNSNNNEQITRQKSFSNENRRHMFKGRYTVSSTPHLSPYFKKKKKETFCCMYTPLVNRCKTSAKKKEEKGAFTVYLWT